MKHIIHKYSFQFSLLIFALMQCVCVDAQKIKDVQINSLANTDFPVAQSGDVYYATGGSTLVVSFSFDDYSPSEKQTDYKQDSCFVKLNNITDTLTGGKKEAVFEKPDVGINAKAEIVVRYSYQEEQDGGSPKEVVKYDTCYSDTISILPVPSSSLSHKTKTEYKQANHFSVNVTKDGGYTEGWKYYLDDEEQPSNEIDIKPSKIPLYQTYIVKAINYAPDNQTIWYKDSDSYTIYFYKAISVKKGEGSEKKKYFYKNTGESKWTVTTSGGDDDGWEYTWIGGENRKKDSKDKFYNPYPSDVNVNAIDSVITVYAVNYSTDGNRHELGRDTLRLDTISVFRKAEIVGTDTLIKQYVCRNQCELTVKGNGGCDDGWHYSLLNGNSQQEGNFQISKPEASSLPKDTTYIINAVNYAPDKVTRLDSIACHFKVYFYDSIHVFKGNYPEKKYFYKNTGESKWTVTTSGGDDNGWEYTWTGGINSKVDSKDKFYSPYPSDVNVNAIDSVITVYAVNYSTDGNRQELGRDTLRFDPISVYNEAKQKTLEPNKKVYTKESKYSLSNIWENGNPKGWKYYDKDDKEILDQLTIQKPDKLPSDSTYTIRAVNYPPDETKETWVDTTYTFYMYFYNEPVISKKSTQETNFYKSTKDSVWAVNIEECSDRKNLTIEWHINGAKTQETSESFCPFGTEVESNMLNQDIEAVAIYKSEDNKDSILWTDTLRFDKINVYKAINIKPDKSITGKLSKSIYVGNQVTFGLVKAPEDGYPGGWKYTWDKGTPEGSIVTDYPTKGENTYTLTAKNFYGETPWDSIKVEYKVNAYNPPTLKDSSAICLQDIDTEHYYPHQDSKINLTYPTEVDIPQNPYCLIEGDTVRINVDTIAGMDNTWTYTIDSIYNESPGQKVKQNAPYTFIPSKQGTYQIVINATNGDKAKHDDDSEWAYFNPTITRTFKVYDKPNINSDTVNVNILAGNSYTAQALSEGKSSEGWTFSWKGYSGPGTESLREISTDGSIISKDTITNSFTGSFTCGDYVRYEGGKTYNLFVWPKPKVGLTIKLHEKAINTEHEVGDINYYDISTANDTTCTIDCYTNDQLDIAYNVSGGYADTNGGWTFTGKDEKPQSVDITDCQKVEGAGNDALTRRIQDGSKYVTRKYALNLKNQVPDGVDIATESRVWCDTTVYVTVNIWNIPSSITYNAQDSVGFSGYSSKSWNNGDEVYVYDGGNDANNVNFSLSHNYGYTGDKGGWSYSWKADNENLSNDSTCIYKPSTSADDEIKTITVETSNKIGNNYGFYDKKVYNAHVYKKAEFSDGFTITDDNQGRQISGNILAVRSGNKVNVSVNPTKYGYSSSYQYKWSKTGIVAESNVSDTVWTWTAAATENAMDKGTGTATISLSGSNVGPYGNVWDSQSYAPQTVTVYNRPQTPTSLKTKGTGASGTMICITSVSDEDLENKEYYLTFGYTDASGIDHDVTTQKQENSGQVRWAKGFTSAEMRSNAYVYATWKYPDNVTITSGKRYVDRVDESWDGSDYSKSTNTAIFAAGYVPSLDPQDSGEQGDNSDTSTGFGRIVRIIGMDGTIKSSVSDIPNGMYILEDEQGVTRKFIVK